MTGESRREDTTASGEHRQGDATEAELRRLAYYDHLTGLPNRIAMAERIDAALQRSNREGTSTALLFVDLDFFKLVNDTLGHTAGDELLALVAGRLRALGDDRVTAGRHGGDEFLLLIGDLPRAAAAAEAEITEIGARLAAVMSEPFTVSRSSFEMSVSAGASFFPTDATSRQDLLEHSDQAMYVAKRQGRAQLALFEAPERHSVLELETTLRARRALEAGEFELFYQPVIEIADGDKLGGLEALLRWNDPDRGLVAPSAFLPFVENSLLIEEIGEWVFDEVCRQLAEWRGRGFSPRLSFNIPARQLRRPGFAEFIVDTAARHEVDLTRIAAEITESNAVDLDAVLPTLDALCEAGLVLSLDDFGIRHSSLARLRAMPFTLLKTDRSFMVGVPGDRAAEDLLEGIISLGKTLGLRVIVEGVETAEQRRELLRLGCRIAQGYHLGVPVPAAEIETQWGEGTTAAPSPPTEAYSERRARSQVA
jgi:diguanylate cyclase (GGDEF)-like protein